MKKQEDKEYFSVINKIEFLWSSSYFVFHQQLVDLLHIFGDLLPDPLRNRINIGDYAHKLIEFAEIGYVITDKKIIGIIVLYANDHESGISHIPFVSVLPEYQGLGIGKTIISRAIALSRERNMHSLWLTVEKNNLLAQHVYAINGFRITGSSETKVKMEINLVENYDKLSPQITPIESADRLSSIFGLNIDLKIKRDDLYPFVGGGIKARKIGYIVKEAIKQGYDVLVTNGGPQSNHARATAIIAANLGLKCHLVIVLDLNTVYSNSGNILLMKMSGASIEYCTKDQLSNRMDQAIEHWTNKGHKPLYIWGGGHNLQGTTAFVEAASEARIQCGIWIPDYLVIASGTGSTQAGLSIGYSDLPTKVIGVSISRESGRGTKIILDCIDEFLNANSEYSKNVHVFFRDDWILGGYEQYNQELFSLIDKAAKTGYFFDPTYSGKALLGLNSMVKNCKIPTGSKVLFWHTGGLMNLQASLKYTEGKFHL